MGDELTKDELQKLRVFQDPACQMRREEAFMREMLEHWTKVRWVQQLALFSTRSACSESSFIYYNEL
jgi:hypothetical protein